MGSTVFDPLTWKGTTSILCTRAWISPRPMLQGHQRPHRWGDAVRRGLRWRSGGAVGATWARQGTACQGVPCANLTSNRQQGIVFKQCRAVAIGCHGSMGRVNSFQWPEVESLSIVAVECCQQWLRTPKLGARVVFVSRADLPGLVIPSKSERLA